MKNMLQDSKWVFWLLAVGVLIALFVVFSSFLLGKADDEFSVEYEYQSKSSEGVSVNVEMIESHHSPVMPETRTTTVVLKDGSGN